jgi:hypothetical protein
MFHLPYILFGFWESCNRAHLVLEET